MNFLAHIYLSGENNKIKLGNFIADSIRGSSYKEFPLEIQQGILLHRAIDSYTDSHKTVRKSTKRLHANYHHYSGVIVDILYDHFLARNWSDYSEIPLAIYVADFYSLLEENFEILPLRVQRMLPHMIADNWLLSYATTTGIANILNQMNKRTKNKSKMNLAIKELEVFYDEFEQEFRLFFEELITFSQHKLTTF